MEEEQYRVLNPASTSVGQNGSTGLFSSVPLLQVHFSNNDFLGVMVRFFWMLGLY